MKLNIGCGAFPIEGYVNIDQYVEGADVMADFRTLSYEGVEEVIMSHILEHLPWVETVDVLRLVHSWMAPEAALKVEVPDMESILPVILTVPGWQPLVYGSQQHPGEWHLAGFTAAELEEKLREAGFEKIQTARINSSHSEREGLPCIQALAYA